MSVLKVRRNIIFEQGNCGLFLINQFECIFQLQASTDKIGYPDIYERDSDIDNIYQSVSSDTQNIT